MFRFLPCQAKPRVFNLSTETKYRILQISEYYVWDESKKKLLPENKNMRNEIKINFIKKVVLNGSIYFLYIALLWSFLYHIEEQENNTENRTEVKTHFVKSQSMVSLWTKRMLTHFISKQKTPESYLLASLPHSSCIIHCHDC